MPRFVVLRHELPPERGPCGSDRTSHWDLMLEHEGQLITWALPAFPEPDAVVVAIRLPDHRLAYLDYEGPVSRDRGHVRRVEEGSYAVCRGDWESLGSAVCSLVELEVRGTRLRGTLQLRQLSIPGATWEIRLLSQSDVA